MLEAIKNFSADFRLSHKILKLIAEIDEFKGKWQIFSNLSPDRLSSLRRVATIESVIEDNKNSYYDALRKTQRSLPADEIDWESWIVFFLRCLKKQKDNLERKLEREKLLAVKLPKLSAEILTFIREHERLSISELENLTQANRNTLKVRLRELTKDGYLTQHGKARATWYSLAK
jgi:Fic family protein